MTLTYSVNDKAPQGELEVGSNGGFPASIILGLAIAVLAVALVVILIWHQRKNINNLNVSRQPAPTLMSICFYGNIAEYKNIR